MKDEFKEYPAPEEDVLRLNTVRSDLILWLVERFQTLLAEGWQGDELGFMDEWFEWVDKDSYINESTLFFDENELKELYESAKG